MIARKKTARPTKKMSTTARFERAVKERKSEEYVLRLYITGMTPRSIRAIENLQEICDQYLSGRYTLEVIDIFQRPKLVRGEQVIAAPTLIKQLPTPLRRFVGDLSDKEKVLFGLDLKVRDGKTTPD